MADALTTEDFGQLYTMLTSPDAAIRTTALQASAKLTPDEAQQFFAYQHAVNQPDLAARRDQNVVTVGDVGVSPEMLLGGGLAAGKVVGALRTGGALAGAGEAVTQAAPFVKYELTKSALHAMGLPEPLAGIAGAIVTGYNPRSRAAAAAEPTGPVDPAAPHLDPSRAGAREQPDAASRSPSGMRFGTGTPTPTRDVPPVYAPRPTPSDRSIRSRRSAWNGRARRAAGRGPPHDERARHRRPHAFQTVAPIDPATVTAAPSAPRRGGAGRR